MLTATPVLIGRGHTSLWNLPVTCRPLSSSAATQEVRNAPGCGLFLASAQKIKNQKPLSRFLKPACHRRSETLLVCSSAPASWERGSQFVTSRYHSSPLSAPVLTTPHLCFGLCVCVRLARLDFSRSSCQRPLTAQKWHGAARRCSVLMGGGQQTVQHTGFAAILSYELPGGEVPPTVRLQPAFLMDGVERAPHALLQTKQTVSPVILLLALWPFSGRPVRFGISTF